MWGGKHQNIDGTVIESRSSITKQLKVSTMTWSINWRVSSINYKHLRTDRITHLDRGRRWRHCPANKAGSVRKRDGLERLNQEWAAGHWRRKRKLIEGISFFFFWGSALTEAYRELDRNKLRPIFSVSGDEKIHPDIHERCWVSGLSLSPSTTD